MDLQEYIKSLVQQELDEMSVSGDAGPYSTPFAFAKKGQKTNAAIKTAQSQGMKLVPKGMPKNSKMLDYKELWKGKKSAMNENMTAEEAVKQLRPLLAHTIEHDKLSGEYSEWLNKVKAGDDEILDRMWDLAGNSVDKFAINVLSKLKESNYDKVSQQGQPSEYSAPSGYTAASGYTAPSGYDKNENMKESLLNIIEKEMINEVTYGKFKKDVKHRTKSEQLHKAIREVKRKLTEIDRIVEYTSRMKQELSEDGGINYWKATQKNVASISEMVNQLNNKIKNLNQ
jgi:hypothetical protein